MSDPTALLVLVARLQEGGEGATEGGGIGSFLVPMALVMLVFWFVMLGPERKQRKRREEMLGQLGKGDKVLTTSGMHGSVAQIQDDVVTLQVADGVRLRFARSAIQSVLTEKSEDDKGDGKDGSKS